MTQSTDNIDQMSTKTERITCPQCGRTSSHPEDLKHRYCGFCHQWHDLMQLQSTKTDSIMNRSDAETMARQKTELQTDNERQEQVLIVDEFWSSLDSVDKLAVVLWWDHGPQ